MSNPEIKDHPQLSAPSADQSRPALLVDMSDPSVSRIAKQLLAENTQRDKLATSLAANGGDQFDATVYLDCSNQGVCMTPSDGKTKSFYGTVAPVDRAASEVETALDAGSRKTLLDQSLFNESDLASHLSGSTQTFDAPMRADQSGYWATESRPYEIKLVDELHATSGEITFGTLARDALQACNGDSQLAILTLANFSKNMAAVERRQVKPEDIDSSVRSEYSKTNIDDIFHRIEPLSDSPQEQYNKEGAIYHFFGAMLAASQWGVITKGFVENDNFGLSLTDLGGRTDPIKNAAGLDGVQVGLDVMGYSRKPGLVGRVERTVLPAIGFGIANDPDSSD